MKLEGIKWDKYSKAGLDQSRGGVVYDEKPSSTSLSAAEMSLMK